jgi:glutathione synthase/RimK-type ligase-like ATP-grasp enzyme
VIVLWGVPGDGPLDAVHACVSRIGADFRMLDQRNGARSSATLRIERRDLALEIEGPGEAGRIEFKEVGAAYLRPIETERALPPDAGDDGAARLRADRVDRALIAWADLTAALAVNPPAAMAANNSKPYQLGLVKRYGFAVPETLVTTDPEAVRAFAARHGRIIYKSVSGTRSIVNMLAEAALERLDDVANAPTQFQAYVPGADVRVHVVGDEIFATEVHSDAHDYRYASRSGNEVELAATAVPADVADRCRAMAAGMGLAVAGIDLRRTPDGCWVCFEVNPSPAFVYYEEATGQPIGQAIARLLVRADEAHRRNGRERSGYGIPSLSGTKKNSDMLLLAGSGRRSRSES